MCLETEYWLFVPIWLCSVRMKIPGAVIVSGYVDEMPLDPDWGMGSTTVSLEKTIAADKFNST